MASLVIPEAVWQKIVVEGTGQPGAEQVRQIDWIKVEPVANRALVQALQRELDAGEAGAIALALEVDAEFLLMDEQLGREVARYMGVRCVGLNR